MIVAKLTIQYDRGVAYNQPEDLNATIGKQTTTEDGKVIRGIGTHFKSVADAERVKRLDQEAKGLYCEFREAFMATPIEGVYAIPERGAGRAWLSARRPGVSPEIKVRVSEFVLETYDSLEASEITDWSRKVKAQLSSVQLGRHKEADENGLAALLTLAKCPVLSRDTAQRIKDLVAQLKANQITKIDLRRKIDTLNVKIETAPLAAQVRLLRSQ